MKPLRFFHCLLLLLCFAGTASADKLPNIVLIMADDLGYGDLGCYGHPSIRTPNLDRMASEGLRFTDFYVAACVCTPSRAALLTGRLPVRSGMAGGPTNHVLYVRHTTGLPTNEVTIARALKQKGYVTGCIGKWHLGHEAPYRPTSHGFDSYYGLLWSNDMEPSRRIVRGASGLLNPKEEYWLPTLMKNDKVLEKPVEQASLTRRYTEEAVAFIKENKKRPFFLYLPHTFPHVPLFASERFKGKSRAGIYGDTVEELDWSVGQVLETLRREKLDKNTLVFFTSDNGPWLIKGLAGGSPGILKDGKGGTYEGGMRVPGIAWWPGRIQPGVTSELACSMDLFTTALKLAGVPPPQDRIIDGVDLSPILFGDGSSLRQSMFFYYGARLYAVRHGSYKAHFTTHPGYSKEAPVQHDPPLLFHLGWDPSERVNIARDHPEVLARIAQEVAQHKANLVPGEPQF